MGEPAIRERISISSGWQVQRQLGRGQYGTAYLVSWERSKAGAERRDKYRDGEQAVAKVVGLEFLPEKEHNLAFQEVELMRNLRHPHIVALRDHFITEASLELCIVMEFCDSGDMKGEVTRRAQVKPADLIPEPQIMIWFVQMTLALNYMHQRHILHRDLKSSNIFLTKNSSSGHDVRLGDFGISRVLEGTVDVAATVVGTPYYMSPEVCKAEPYGYKSDVWALGCVLYEMCMLKHAFESQSLLGLVYKIVSETYEPIPPQYSADLRTLIDDVLDKSSSKRPSGTELVSQAYVRRFDIHGQADKDAQASRGDTGNKAQTEPKTMQSQPSSRTATSRSSPSLAPMSGSKAGRNNGENMRTVEPMPGHPAAEPAQDQPIRREWHAPPFVAAATSAATAQASQAAGQLDIDDAELKARVLLNRVRRALAVRQQNWLQVFASFDHTGEGQLKEAEFERAVKSMALGLSDQEIREVRLFLQGTTGCVPVDLFGNALHRVVPEVLQLQDWGRNVLKDLTQEADRLNDADAHAVCPGARVRVHGLQSAAGSKLNGSEGVVEKWDAATCRWVVKVGAAVKSVRDEHLEATSPGAATAVLSASSSDTIAIYRLLCTDGVTAVLESKFQSLLKRLLPGLAETDHKRLFLLLPKCPDGKIDVPEALSQLASSFKGGEQTLHLGQTLPQGTTLLGGRATGIGGASPSKLVPGRLNPGPPVGPGARHATPAWGPSPMKTAMPSSPLSPTRVPGSVGSPRGGATPNMSPGPSMMLGVGNASGSSSRAEAVLLRLAQRLFGRARAPGPGIDVLRLFSARPDAISLDEFMDAVSVLPVGISRAEVQSVFTYIRSSGEAWLPFVQLMSAAESANSGGVPVEAAGLEQIDVKRLAPALQRFELAGGRALPQEFRVALMQAEPYMTHSQMDWLALLTDKDGEGRLLPGSLLSRLGVGGPARPEPMVRGNIPPRPPPVSSKASVAPGAPQLLVVSAVLGRVRGRLFRAGPQLTLASVLSLFDIADAGNRQQGAMVSRDLLGVLLGNLCLGISVAEADELVGALAAGGSKRVGDDGSVQINLLYDLMDKAGEPEMDNLVMELREAAQRRLSGRGMQIASALGAAAGDWISEVEFRRGLKSALADSGLVPKSTASDEEEQFLLLAEKNAVGHIYWKLFAQECCGWIDIEQISELGEEPPSPTRKVRPGAAAALSVSQQSWRSSKAAEKGDKSGRSVIVQSGKGYSDPPMSPSSMQSKRSLCCLRRRS